MRQMRQRMKCTQGKAGRGFEEMRVRMRMQECVHSLPASGPSFCLLSLDATRRRGEGGNSIRVLATSRLQYSTSRSLANQVASSSSYTYPGLKIGCGDANSGLRIQIFRARVVLSSGSGWGNTNEPARQMGDALEGLRHMEAWKGRMGAICIGCIAHRMRPNWNCTVCRGSSCYARNLCPPRLGSRARRCEFQRVPILGCGEPGSRGEEEQGRRGRKGSWESRGWDGRGWSHPKTRPTRCAWTRSVFSYARISRLPHSFSCLQSAPAANLRMRIERSRRAVLIRWSGAGRKTRRCISYYGAGDEGKTEDGQRGRRMEGLRVLLASPRTRQTRWMCVVFSFALAFQPLPM
ncbi:hypothetical protein C8R47DRAFT_572918 [Mycena vitilis]|nr:hypothetical protein C8R47DRAFT_572918 [Mycena vitilis]